MKGRIHVDADRIASIVLTRGLVEEISKSGSVILSNYAKGIRLNTLMLLGICFDRDYF